MTSKFFILKTQSESSEFLGWCDTKLEAIEKREIIAKKWIDKERELPENKDFKFYICREGDLIDIYKQSKGSVFNGFMTKVSSFSIFDCEKIIL